MYVCAVHCSIGLLSEAMHVVPCRLQLLAQVVQCMRSCLCWHLMRILDRSSEYGLHAHALRGAARVSLLCRPERQAASRVQQQRCRARQDSHESGCSSWRLKWLWSCFHTLSELHLEPAATAVALGGRSVGRQFYLCVMAMQCQQSLAFATHFCAWTVCMHL